MTAGSFEKSAEGPANPSRNDALTEAVFRLLCLLLFCSSISDAMGFESVQVTSSAAQIPLGENTYYLEDPTNGLTIREILSQEDSLPWEKTHTDSANFGYTYSTFWFAIAFTNHHNQATQGLIEIAYSVLDRVDVYRISDSDIIEQLQLGDQLPFDQRPRDYRNFIVPLTLSPGQTATVYFKVRTSSALQFPVKYWTQAAFYDGIQWQTLAQGLFFGTMGVMVLYNLLLYFFVRDRSYFFYVLYTICITLFQLAHQGFGYQLLWSDFTWWQNKAVPVSLSLGLLAISLFTNQFLSLKNGHPTLSRYFLACATISGAVAAASFVIPYAVVIRGIALLALPVVVSSYFAAIYLWWNGTRSARFFVIGWTAFIISAVLLVLNKFGFIPYNAITENAIQFGAMLEVCLFSIALADRINTARQEKLQAQTEAIGNLNKYRDLYERAFEGIFHKELAGPFLSVNPSFARILGYSSPQAFLDSASTTAIEHYLEPRSQHEVQERLESEGHVLAYETQGRRKDGSQFWGSLSARVVKDGKTGANYVEGSLIDITERKETEERLAFLAKHDTLTGLGNRNLMYEHLHRAIARCERSKTGVTLLFLDLDQFKAINDTLGHDVGDLVIKGVSERLQESVREGDLVSRLGGDEFMVIIEGVPRNVPRIGANVANSILQSLTQPLHIAGSKIAISSSIGIAAYPEAGENPMDLIKAADMAMYKAKEDGRGNYCFYSETLDEKFTRNAMLENSLRGGIDESAFRLVYQPIIDLKTEGVVSLEALLRWQHPQEGWISPNEFIPIMEKTGTIHGIGQWVLEKACAQMKQWHENLDLPTYLGVSVNLSTYHLRKANFVERVRDSLEKTGLESELLHLEVTESVLIDDWDRRIALLKSVGGLGVHLSIDDFGTGYSSLEYLKRLPVQSVKIDRSFVRDISTDPDDAEIIKAIIVLARVLGLKVVAEGIETQAQLDFLVTEHCDEGQGYLFCRPLPPEQMTEYLELGQVHPNVA